MTVTPSMLRVLAAAFSFALLLDISLILILSIATDVRKPEPLFYLALYGIIFILCYVSIYLSAPKAIELTNNKIILHHHFDPPTHILWREINWADYRKKPSCLWRIFSKKGTSLTIPQGTLTRRDEDTISQLIVRQLPEVTLSGTQAELRNVHGIT